MATLIEQESEKKIKQGQNNHVDEEIEIDLMDILRRIVGIRKAIYKAAGIGLLIGIVVAISIPKQYTVTVTLSPEMGSAKEGGLSGLAASFLGFGSRQIDSYQFHTAGHRSQDRRNFFLPQQRNAYYYFLRNVPCGRRWLYHRYSGYQGLRHIRYGRRRDRTLFSRNIQNLRRLQIWQLYTSS